MYYIMIIPQLLRLGFLFLLDPTAPHSLTPTPTPTPTLTLTLTLTVGGP